MSVNKTTLDTVFRNPQTTSTATRLTFHGRGKTSSFPTARLRWGWTIQIFWKRPQASRSSRCLFVNSCAFVCFVSIGRARDPAGCFIVASNSTCCECNADEKRVPGAQHTFDQAQPQRQPQISALYKCTPLFGICFLLEVLKFYDPSTYSIIGHPPNFSNLKIARIFHWSAWLLSNCLLQVALSSLRTLA